MAAQTNNDVPPAGPRFGRDLTTGSIPRHLVRFSLPMLAGSALQTAYSFINAIWVGQFLGEEALAAVTVSFPVVFVLIALGAGLTMATTILVAQHWGAKDMPSVRKVVVSSTILMSVLGLVLTIVGEIFSARILLAMNTQADIFPLASEYMKVFLLSLPLMFGFFLVRSMLQGIGDSTTPLYFQTGSVILTTVLDPVLMFGLVGMPRLGLNGTAWATLISHVLALAAMIAYLRKKRNPVAPSLNVREFSLRTTWTTVKVGMPSAVQQSLVSLGMIFVTGIINGFGKTATAAFGAAMRIDQLAFMPAMTFSMAISTLAGQNIGAGRYDRIRKIFFWGCALSCGVTLACSLLVVSLPGTLLRIFIGDPPVIETGADYLRIVGACYVFFSVMFVSNGIINGSGHTFVTTLVSLVSLWVVRVPLAHWLSQRWNSVTGVWVAIAVSFGVSMTASLLYYMTGLWRKPVIRRLVAPPPPQSPQAVFGEETGEA